MASHAPRVVSSSPAAAVTGGCVDTNTTFVQADPTTFRALVQKLTGAPGSGKTAGERRHQGAGVAQAPPQPTRRPKLQERRRAAPARLELARPQPLYYSHHHHRLMHSPVSPMDYAIVMASSSSCSSLSSSTSSSLSPSPPASSSSCGVVITKEEEEREEKAIASKGFYLHSSPRTGAGDGERPKLLPLFPVYSPRSSSLARS
ncbi:VQ motif-containing protein 31 [Oryza brachyantha]|uniref:VQ motif-containing protein 31 n=1 Tax=Oryza brachyantha TaxID=4533 RepID=UPI001ADC58F1|nr:VQ motif-containing protein 31 [Oryza brachyantha]